MTSAISISCATSSSPSSTHTITNPSSSFSHPSFLTVVPPMEALNAASAVLPPISCLFHTKNPSSPSPFLPVSHLKTPISARFSPNPPTLRECVSRGFHGGMVLLSSVVNAELARALTYEEALQQSVSSSDAESVISFAGDNPALIFGGVAVLGLPLILSRLFTKPSKAWGVESARSAYEKLGADASAQLVDIRPLGDLKTVGAPNLKAVGKKSVSLVYKGEDKPGFLKKLALKFKDPQNTTLFILDKFDGNSELVAELVTVNGFKAAYAVKDGVEGPRGWIKSGLPWIEPKKAFSLDLSNLTDSVSSAIGDSDGLSVALAVAAATGLGFLTFTEIETVLQLLGSVALIQLVSKQFLIAENRQTTLKQVDEFLNTKVAPNELLDDVKAIGKALLPTIVTRTLPAPPPAPAPAEASAEPVSVDDTVMKAEVVPEPKEESDPPVESAPPVPEVQAQSNGGFPRPQSPFPYYPDLKPPSSPRPSQP